MDIERLNAANKYYIIRHALKTNNVTETCKTFGISRTIYYRWYNEYRKSGLEGLKEKTREKPDMPNKVSKEIEGLILKHVLKHPEDGPKRIYYELKSKGIVVGETGIYNVLKRHKLNCKEERKAYSRARSIKNEVQSEAKKSDLKMEDIGQVQPGYAVIQTTSYIGKIGQIGSVYQIVLLDLFSNFAFAKVYTSKSSMNAIDLMEMSIIPMIRVFDIKISNLITNNSKEYTTNWDRGMHKYDEFLKMNKIKHMSFPAKNKNIFGAMDRFISILQEEFYDEVLRNDTYSSLDELENGLNKYIRYYNYERSIDEGVHKGKPPIEVIYRQLEGDKPLPLWFYIKTSNI